MRTAVQDVRYAMRQLWHNPGFSLTAVLSLALGIGATAAVFSVIYAVLMHPFPYPTADRIVRLLAKTPQDDRYGINLNGPQIRELRQSPVIEGLLVIDDWSLSLTGGDLPESVEAAYLSSNSFHDLGVPMLLGRGLSPADSVDGKEPQPVCVLSWKFWQRHFQGSPSALGKTIELDRKTYTVVGVAPPRFTWYSGDVYLPLKLTSDPGPVFMVNVLLKPGVTRPAAESALQPILEEFARQTPQRFPEHFQVLLPGLNDWVIHSLGRTLYLLFGAVGMLLIIGCGNVSILLLARGTAREHELAVRAAVGAGRLRILRQLLTEALVLALAGAALGIGLAFALLKLIVTMLPRNSFAPEVAIQINATVLLFSAAVAVGTAILFGLWPALRLSRPQIAPAMQGSARRVAGSVPGRRTHGMLIAGQIALTLTLVVSACGALRAFVRLMHTPLGYDPSNVLPVWIPLHSGAYTTWSDRAAYFDRVRNELATIPGVTETAISSNATPPDNGDLVRYEILGKPMHEQPTGLVNLVSPGYFSLLRIPLVQGRLWTEADNLRGAHYAVINQTMARTMFPSGDAIGHSVRLPQFEGRATIVIAAPDIARSWLQIVGIVADARDDGLKRPIIPAIYVPDTLFMRESTQVLVRTSVPPATLVRAIRTRLRAINAEQQTGSEIDDLEQWIVDQPEWTQEHLVAWIFGSFAALALALAGVGLYSVVSYSVAQRTNEFGIRMALGAPRGHVIRIVFASVALSAGAGIVAGVALTLATNRLLSGWSGGAWSDPVILFGSAVVLAAVAALACALPARRAAAVNPMIALRQF